MAKQADKYSKTEAEFRFLAALRGGLSTPPITLKSRKPPKRKARKPSARGKA